MKTEPKIKLPWDEHFLDGPYRVGGEDGDYWVETSSRRAANKSGFPIFGSKEIDESVLKLLAAAPLLSDVAVAAAKYLARIDAGTPKLARASREELRAALDKAGIEVGE